MAEQLELFETEWKANDFKTRPFPFSSRYTRYDFSHSGCWIDYQDGEYILSPFHHRNHIYSCYFTNKVKFTRWPASKLPYDFYKTDEEKAAEDERYRKYLAQQQEAKPKRKQSKWSREAKARNRRKRLKARIEKKHGYDPDQPTMFDDEILAEIDFEYQMKIAEMPDYYAGKDVEFF